MSAFKDIIDKVTVHEDVDEVTGLSRLIIVDSPDEKKQPAIEIMSADGTVVHKYHMPSNAHLMVTNSETVLRGRRAGEDPARDHEDEGHHGRSAARGGALRGPQAARDGRDLRDRRHRSPRRRRQGTPQDPRGARRRDRRAGVLAAARGPRQRAGRRSRARRRAVDGRSAQPARHPGGSRREGAAGLPGERDPGGLPAAGRRHQRQAHRGHRAGR